MNSSSYGNVSWKVFVYGTYVVVAIFLVVYIFFALYARRSALKNLKEEGFLENENK